jgi:phosphopantothenoylcysteine decarboxylase/phosphopantothenate--cysteine ligase
MNKEMWSHPATQRNAATLEQDGTIFLGPDRGDQACGETGDGRMLEPEDLLQALEHQLSPKFLAGRHCLITAGPTFEAIDPVRGITNRSSGKMGFAIARAASQAGAMVHLIAGPVSLKSPWQVHRTDVVSALDMKQAVDRALESMQNSVIERSIFISVAAVADWRPDEIASQKIKKQQGASTPSLRFVENPDILAGVAARSPRPFCVGFAAESEMLHEHGEAKRKKKNIPMLAANIGHDTFGQDLNQLLLLDAQGSRSLPLATKEKLAQQLIEAIASDLS